MSDVVYRSDWVHPEAPVQYDKDRYCMRGAKCKHADTLGGPAKLNSYTTPAMGGPEPIYLCSACKVAWSDSGLTARMFVGVKKKRTTSYKLPKLREIRKEQGISPYDLAGMVNCDPSTVMHIERGRKSSSVLAGRFARTLDVSINKLRGLR